MIENPSTEKIILKNMLLELDYLIKDLAEKNEKKHIPYYIHLQNLIKEQECNI